MNDLDSVPRSLRRWVAALLGPPWRLEMEERPVNVPDDRRPFGVLLPTSDQETLFARHSIPQGDIRRGMTWTVALYPPLEETPALASAAARDLAALLDDALVCGTKEGDAEFSYPGTIPLWDYTGVPLVGPDRAGPEEPVSSMTADTHSVRPLADPEDPLRYTVMLTVRLTWWSPGRVRDPGPIVARVPGTWVP